MTETRDLEILDLLAKNERAVAMLYEGFSAALPDMRDFWLKLAHDERKHSDILLRIGQLVSTGEVTLSPSRFNPAVISSTIKYIASRRAALPAGKTNAIEALSIAADIERGIIEKDFLSIVLPAKEPLRSQVASIIAQTQEHHLLVSKRLQAERLRR